MARIHFPEDFAKQQKLLTDLNAKHIADGAASDLIPYLTQQGINLAADVATGAQAALHEKAHAQNSKATEDFRQLRDNHFSLLFASFKGMVQFLKSLFKGNERALGAWGVAVDGKAKISYPTDFDGQAKLLDAFFQKHKALAAASPLLPYLAKQSISIANFLAELSIATTHHTAMKAAAKNAEEERVERDNLWLPVAKRLRGTVGFLKKLNADNPKALGAYGVMVNDTPRPPRLRTTTLKPGAQITIQNATIGGTLTNTGAVDLRLHRGRNAKGIAVILPVGAQLGIMKGWSIVTVVNTSRLEAAKFTVLASHNWT